MVYSITDITSIRWKGDAPEHISAFKSEWENVVDNMDPNVGIGDEALKCILYERMKDSLVFDADVTHYVRYKPDKTEALRRVPRAQRNDKRKGKGRSRR